MGMRLHTLTFLVLLLAAQPCAAQNVVDGFIGRVYTSASGQKMPYRLFVPPAYDNQKQYPLVLWLHGAGGAGTKKRAPIFGDQNSRTHTWERAQKQAKDSNFVGVSPKPTKLILD